MRYARASAVSGGPVSWVGEIGEGWDIFGVPNGGYVMSIATRAMENETDGRQLIATTGHYLNPARPGPISIETAVLKAGRSLATVEANVSSDDNALMTATAIFADPDRPVSGHNLVLAKPPALPPPEECVLLEPEDPAPLPPPFAGKVEVRIHPEDAEAFVNETATEPQMRGWFRLKDDEPLDAHAVVMASDAFPPAIFGSTLPVGWTPTISLTVQIRDPAPVGWLACRFSTRVVTSGMLEEDGELWDEEGQPVALSRQLALVPR